MEELRVFCKYALAQRLGRMLGCGELAAEKKLRKACMMAERDIDVGGYIVIVRHRKDGTADQLDRRLRVHLNRREVTGFDLLRN